MGSSASKPPTPATQQQQSFPDRLRATVEEEVARKMMQQREVNMALNIARARDTIQIFGSLYVAGIGGVGVAKLAGKPVPPVVAIPAVIGAVVLGNMADMAYGNKLQRVCKEAEHILDQERPRFVPFKQAPFARFYSEEEKAVLFDQSTAVGELFPSSTFARGFVPSPPASKTQQ